jgi:hypothetical protein
VREFEPRRPVLIATLVFIAAGLTLLWPIFAGQFLAGPFSDQFEAGYGFRLFGAEYFREYGKIPLWNPYLFGGMPFVAAMHGDVFYPTAWLRWIVPTDVGMNLGFAVHIILAGCTMFAFLRALGTGWGGAVVGGISYELSGLVAGLVNPGHDGKLFVAALAPLLLLAILRAVRDGRTSAYGLIALTVGLSLHGHPQMSYYLLIAALLWGLWLLFVAAERPAAHQRVKVVLLALGAVALGFGIYMIQAMPFYQYIPFSPRAEGGTSGDWEYATSYAFPPSEFWSLFMPEFNGIQRAYWGVNPAKLHTEFVGLIPLALAWLGIRDRSRRSLIIALGVIGVLFLLVAFGGHTPFYRLWFEFMPMMKKVRAAGMAFLFCVIPICVFAGFGADRLLKGEVSFRQAVLPIAVLGAIGLLGALGLLQSVAEAVAIPERIQGALANASELRMGGVRVLVMALVGMGVVWAVTSGKVTAAVAALLLSVAVLGDMYSVERKFFNYSPNVAVTYANDAITTELQKRLQPSHRFGLGAPQRVLDAGAYRGSWLMAHYIPTLLGYHGNQIRFFDELLGGKLNGHPNAVNPSIWRLFGVGFLVVGDTIQLSGWSRLVGPVQTTAGVPAVLYGADSPPSWATVVPAAVKVPEDQIIPTLLDTRFPVDRVVLFPDTSSAVVVPIGDSLPEASPVQAKVTQWEPGKMTIALTGQATAASWLVVSENWYPDWRATVDGGQADVLRGQFSLITVSVPVGAREITLEFRSRAYERGRMITFISLIAALGLWLVPLVRRRRADG